MNITHSLSRSFALSRARALVHTRCRGHQQSHPLSLALLVSLDLSLPRIFSHTPVAEGANNLTRSFSLSLSLSRARVFSLTHPRCKERQNSRALSFLSPLSITHPLQRAPKIAKGALSRSLSLVKGAAKGALAFQRGVSSRSLALSLTRCKGRQQSRHVSNQKTFPQIFLSWKAARPSSRTRALPRR